MSQITKFNPFVIAVLIIVTSMTGNIHSWRYQTKCTKTAESSSLQTSVENYSIVEDFEHILVPNTQRSIIQANKMTLKCPNSNDFLFLGLTQYGVSSAKTNTNKCVIKENDCLVTVDYLASQCNGLNSCDVQLDAQFLHTCKNLSDYVSIAYECITGSKQINVCSNEETFIIDSTFTEAKSDLNARFGSFYLSSPNYPWEYESNLHNCSCHLEYVEIDGAPMKKDTMNLALKTYEFDLEEGENNKCNKDKLSVEGDEAGVELCGQHGDFKQFYTKGQLVKVNFTSDDVITRRGFLIEIAPVAETICPRGTVRFDENKCVKLFDNQYVTHRQASKACARRQGKLLKINDFVDNIRLSGFMKQQTQSVWTDFISQKKSNHLSFLNLKKRRQTNSLGCVSRETDFWTVQSCYTKLPYICEFEAINVRKPAPVSVTPKNKLIRVSCGKLTNKFVNPTKPATTTEPSTTTITSPTTMKIAEKQPVLLWSSLVDNSADIESIVETSTASTTTSTESIIHIISSLNGHESEENKPSSKHHNINQNLILVIAVISGVAVVFIIINIFCVWNYYQKKFNAFIEKSDPEASTYNRTSTMRSSARRAPVQNNRSMSTVDSYVKIMPFSTETCLLNSDGSSSTGSTSPNQSERLENELKLDILRNYFQSKKLENQLNFYETISNRNNYYTSSICQVKDCKCGMNHGTTNTSVDSLNSAMQLLLSQQFQQQMYEQVAYSDVSPTLSMGSQRPLITGKSVSVPV